MPLVTRRKLGFIVNPIAGMGGRVGLKGTDGDEILQMAIDRGATPSSPERAIEALRRAESIRNSLQLITCPEMMCEAEAVLCGFVPEVISSVGKGRTSAVDTKRAAEHMLAVGVDLILFAGGDGTARDILDVVGDRVPALGIPAGVKIHSAAFAISPRCAGNLAVAFLQGESASLQEAEVMDVDEQAFRDGKVVARLYGYLKVPFEKTMVQSGKVGSSAQEERLFESIASDVIEHMDDKTAYIIGPGTTTRRIMDGLGLQKTLLGVDVVQAGSLLASDVNESQLLKIVANHLTKIVVSVIGGQGFVFGRGSQQISSDVIRKVGRENIVIVATPRKLASLKGASLLVDTGDEQVDRMLEGHMSVVTGHGKRAMYRVKAV